MGRYSKESLVYGVGINDADYPVSARDENGKEWRCPFYKTWKNMLARCYSPAFQRNQPLYKGCSVDERWHRFSHFKSWMLEQDWEDKQLDKDRKFEGNQVYGPDTCQFLSRLENMYSRSNTMHAIYKGFWVRLKEFSNGDMALHSYLYARVREGNLTIEDILEERHRAQQGVHVEWEGLETSLRALCVMYDKDYETIKGRRKAWNTTIYGCMFYDEDPRVSFELTGTGDVVYQFRSKQELVDYLGAVSARVDEYLPICRGSLMLLKQLISEHKPKSTDTRILYTINGVSEYKDYWYNLYETSEPRVSGTMGRLGISFEEAVQRPIERVSRVLLNGEVHTVKQMWLKFGLNPTKSSNYKSIKKWTYKQVLEWYGVDTKDITVVPL